MENQETVLVIIEPSHERHEALERALTMTKLRDVPPKLYVFICADGDNTDLKARNQKLYKSSKWLNDLSSRLDESGTDYDYEICFSTDWAAAVLDCATRIDALFIMMPDYTADVRHNLFTDSKWFLLRNSFCPVMILRPGASSHRKTVLCAINIQATKQEYIELNDKILLFGKRSAELYNADLYAVNAYKDSMHYPDREQLLSFTGLPTEQVHVEEGLPADVISNYSQTINADLVIVGTLRRSGAAALMRGNTSEKVLGKVTQDVVAIS